MDQFNSDPQTYIHEQAGMLNGLEPAQWEPDLATLDALVGSLEIVGMPPHGIQDQVWALVARSEGGRDEALPTGKAEYTVVFGSDGTLAFTADCNQGAAAYDVTGGMVGGLATYPGPMTLAQCAPESLSDLLVNALAAAQDYRIWPGGHVLELVLPAGGGSLLFSNLGPADAHDPDEPDEPAELPTPEPQTPYGRVVAPQGVNLRTGPGTMYPVVGFVPLGTEGEIIGRSADRFWWVARAPQAPNGQVWVSAAYVEVFNVQNVPVIPAPPQPIPTPTPEPEVTATPDPEINFWADQTVIDPGACTTLRWKVENVQTIHVYPQAEPYDKFPVTGEGNRQECPATTTSYELRAQRRDGAVELRQVTIQVKAQNPLANTNWRLTALYVTQVPMPEPAITLSFDAAGQLRGDAGCNSYNAAYAVQGNVISIGPLATTGKLCDERVNAQEGSYLNALPSVSNFEIQGNQLVLRSAGGQELLRYVRQ
jgi:heat shock protein HslJ